MDLRELNLKELTTLQSKVSAAITNFQATKMAAAIAALEKVAKRHGFTLTELTSGQTVRTRTKPGPKYANPANSAETWSGRGQKPHWFRAAMEKGTTPKDLIIKRAA